MALEWLRYIEAGERLGISAEAVRQKAIRQHWQRRPGNDGRTEVRVDVDDVLAALPPRRPRVDHQADTGPTPEQPPVEHAGGVRTLDAMEQHIVTLKGAIARAEALVDAERARTDAERARADDLGAQLMRLHLEGQDKSAEFERNLGDLRKLVDGMKRPWWRRLAG